MSSEKIGKWPALESNPTAMNAYLREIGIPEPTQMVDIYGFEPDLAVMIPQPLHAIILLFPYADKIRDARIAANAAGTKAPEDVFFMKQTISNACGTFALLHALANADGLDLGKGAFSEFLAKARDTPSTERSSLLFNHASMSSAHHNTASLGDTDEPEQVVTHFIAYVLRNGKLIEIDSAHDHAIVCGDSSKEQFIDDVGVQFKKLVALAGENANDFSAMALVGSSP